MRSIIQKKDGICLLCKNLHGDISSKTVEEHHCIYGSANRKLSEKYGLKVYLCAEHHRLGKEAVHRNHDVDLYVKQIAEEHFNETYPTLSFLAIFGRDYHPEDRIKTEYE